jgi:membrane protein YqaA with SNARE-associated domain
MLESITQFAAWVQSWLGAEAGLWGLFFSAFLSATILPGSSEVVMIGLITAYPELAWPAFAVALAGNLVGALLTFGMGYAARQGYERFQRVQWKLDERQMQRLQRLGPPALFLSFVPLAGDALVLAAGWLRLSLPRSVFWIALGKGFRYLLVVLGVQGVLTLV